ncbi:MAG: signal peptide peptidase SppA, partial [Terriglobales bacterium]
MANGGRSRAGLWVLIGGAAFFIFVLAVYTLVYLSLRGEQGTQYVTTGSGDKIAVVEIEGVILDSQPTVRDLKKFADDGSIKAIIIHLNTPGGSAAASEEIYKEVRRIRDEKKKRVVADIAVVGASGGYYVASGANKIFANDASVVGSIGAIMDWYNYGDLVRWAKLKEEVIKSGEFKDTGDPARDLTPAERAYLQGMVMNMKGQFVAAIASGRGLKPEDVAAIADGRVWTGQQALPLKLVDQIGDFEAAVKDTAKAVGIKGEPSLVRPAKERHSMM